MQKINLYWLYCWINYVISLLNKNIDGAKQKNKYEDKSYIYNCEKLGENNLLFM